VAVGYQRRRVVVLGARDTRSGGRRASGGQERRETGGLLDIAKLVVRNHVREEVAARVWPVGDEGEDFGDQPLLHRSVLRSVRDAH
jgi:hypothetical protein